MWPARRLGEDARMDIVAHGLWAGIGVAAVAVARGQAPDRRTLGWAVAPALLPDLLQMLPLLAIAFQPGGWAVLVDHATALPGAEPPLPAWVSLLSHHLHCVMHSAVVAALASAVLAWRCRSPWLAAALWGWWSHIVIDVFTHSADYYPSPVLYPVTMAGFDGIAWNTPWFGAANYAALAAALLGLWRLRRRQRAAAADVPGRPAGR